MGLFGSRKPPKGTVESVVSMLSEYFKRRNLEIDGHVLDAEHDSCGWWLKEGSAKVYIFLQEDKSGNIVIQVYSPRDPRAGEQRRTSLSSLLSAAYDPYLTPHSLG